MIELDERERFEADGPGVFASGAIYAVRARRYHVLHTENLRDAEMVSPASRPGERVDGLQVEP